MKTYTVIYAEDVPHYALGEVEARGSKDAIAKAPESIEALPRIGRPHCFIEQEGKRPIERLSGALIRMSKIRQQTDEVSGCVVGRFDSSRADGVDNRVRKEVRDRARGQDRHVVNYFLT